VLLTVLRLKALERKKQTKAFILGWGTYYLLPGQKSERLAALALTFGGGKDAELLRILQ